MRIPIPVRIDVQAAPGVDPGSRQAAWVFLPDAVGDGALATVLCCAPGGTYDKRYWHLTVPGRDSYSFAEYMAARGLVVIAFDHLGVGESSRPADPFSLTADVVAAANDLLVGELVRRLRAGELAVGVPPVDVHTVVGVGHSVGGMLIVRQQARHRSYDAVAVLGWSNIGLDTHGGDEVVSPFSGLREADLPTLRSHLPDPTRTGHRVGLEKLFYLDDIPPDVLAADAATESAMPGMAGYAAAIPGVVAGDAATLDVPVFLGFAERDTSPDPHAEVAHYRGSPHVSLHILAGSAHCTNLAAPRQEQWAAIRRWIGHPPVGEGDASGE